MSKKFIPLMIIAALAVAALACSVTFNLPNTVEGSGDVEQESRSIESFDKINLSGIGHVYVEMGEEASLEVSAEENLLEYIETYTRNNTLYIEIKEGINIIPTESIDFYITAVELTSVDVSGLADVELPAVEAESFTIDISGAGDIEMDEFVGKLLDVSLSGLGNFSINDGEVEQQNVSISGSGNYNSKNLNSQDAEIKISGLGSATVTVSEYLMVDISGGGDVNYYGSPEVDSDISGLGDLDHLGD